MPAARPIILPPVYRLLANPPEKWHNAPLWCMVWPAGYAAYSVCKVWVAYAGGEADEVPMKWLKRLLLVVAGILAVLVAAAGIGMHYLRSQPEFYRTYQWDGEQRAILNQQAVNKIGAARNQVLAAHYAQVRAQKAQPAPQPLRVTPPIHVTLGEEELNAFLLHNLELNRLKDRSEQYVTGPGIFLRDGRIIAAGWVKELGLLVSCHLEPSLDEQGRVHLRLAKIQGGRLPLPQALVNLAAEQLRAPIQSRLSAWRDQAQMDSSGAFNSSAMAAGLGKMLLEVLEGKAPEALLYVPVEESKWTNVPMRLTQLKVEGQKLIVQAEALTRSERAVLLKQLAPENPADQKSGIARQ